MPSIRPKECYECGAYQWSKLICQDLKNESMCKIEPDYNGGENVISQVVLIRNTQRNLVTGVSQFTLKAVIENKPNPKYL
jgi:hypothetical protein